MDESTWGQWRSNKHQWLLANDQRQEQGGLKGCMALLNTIMSHFWPQGLWDSEVLLWLYWCLSLWWCVWKFGDDNVLCQECSVLTCTLFDSQGVFGVKHGAEVPSSSTMCLLLHVKVIYPHALIPSVVMWTQCEDSIHLDHDATLLWHLKGKRK